MTQPSTHSLVSISQDFIGPLLPPQTKLKDYFYTDDKYKLYSYPDVDDALQDILNEIFISGPKGFGILLSFSHSNSRETRFAMEIMLSVLPIVFLQMLMAT